MKRLLWLCIAVSMAGCNKILEVLRPYTPTEVKYCDIKSVSFIRTFDGVASKKTMNIAYNQKANPDFISISYENPQDFDYGGECFFKYDSLNRLISYERNTYHIITYAYEGNSTLPARDTIITFYHPTYVEDLSYDVKGRLTTLKGRFYENRWSDENYPLEYTTEYKYDEKGNLVTEGYTYDTTTSMLRTNKVWMLAARNWSMNNMYPAKETNSFGLPVKFDRGNFLENDDPEMTVEYDCSGK